MKNLFHNKQQLTVKKQLFILYFFLIIVSLGIFTIISYDYISNIVFEQTIQSATQSYVETDDIIESYFVKMNTIMVNMVALPEVYDLENQDQLDYLGKSIKIKNLINVLNYFKNATGVSDISVYMNNCYSTINTYSELVQNDNNKYMEQQWYKKIVEDPSNRLWYAYDDYDNIKCISYLSRIFHQNELNKELGIIKIDLNKDLLIPILRQNCFTKNSISYICTQDKIILSDVTGLQKHAYYKLNHSLGLENQNIWIRETINGEKVLYRSHKNLLTGFYFVTIIPMKDILSVSNKLRNVMVSLMLIIFVIAFIIAVLISNSSTKRITLLTKEMRNFEEGSNYSYIKSSKKDEIGLLIEGFNSMVEKVSYLMEDKYNMGLEVKNLELKALQSQINPHFLYNSLDMINCLSIKYNIKEIQDMVAALSRFYKLSLSKGDDIVKFENELDHVTNYVNILNLRYGNRFKLIKCIEPNLLEKKVIKIILQPIVENSILHGILAREDKTGTVTIVAREIENNLIIDIKDDGVGIAKEKLETLMKKDNCNPNGGFGLFNINERIKLAYGKQYGLSIESNLGSSTNVTIKMPLITE